MPKNNFSFHFNHKNGYFRRKFLLSRDQKQREFRLQWIQNIEVLSPDVPFLSIINILAMMKKPAHFNAATVFCVYWHWEYVLIKIHLMNLASVESCSPLHWALNKIYSCVECYSRKIIIRLSKTTTTFIN